MSDERPWIIGYSGGKDSTVITHLVYTMLKQLPAERRHKNVYIVYPAISELTTSDVWDILGSNQRKTAWGGDNNQLINLYAGADSGECPFAGISTKDQQQQSCGQSRFGCWVCTVVKEDKSLNGFIKSGHKELKPLAEFRKWLIDIRDRDEYREKKRRDGTVYYTKNNELGYGPFTWEARQMILRRLLKTQIKMNYELITMEELQAIDRIWDEEKDISRRTLVDLYFEETGTPLPWDELKYPLFDEDTQGKIIQYAQDSGVPLDLINAMILGTNMYLEAQFKKSGGLTKKERDELNSKMRQFDRVKNECSKQIRDYVEGIMPFYIAFDLSQAVSEQLLREEHMRQYLASTHDITHKENFIDLMELDHSFNILIYKKQLYTISELYALAENVGIGGLQERLGNAGMQDLMDWFHITSAKSLRKSMKVYLTTETGADGREQALSLYKNVELSQLSKGEKQVFLLSLYWAIIKSSGQNIPFIIDTPFARIDTEHREQLTKLFFTGISDQVIILSTDEEVVGAYRDMIHSRVAHEYLLSNDEITGYTSVAPGYFTKGG